MEYKLINNLWSLKEEMKFQNQIKSFYFTRDMWNENSSIQGYQSHVFLCYFKDLNQLQSEWKTVNGEIALRYQSEVDQKIEGSNFYMCCFCKENVDLKLKNQIENNTFSAKKIIIMDKGYDTLHACEVVENRIFRLNLEMQNKKRNKMHSIILNNFRIYENQKEIILLDKTNKPASLVVIYAKNGNGKTSIFDGVEYALTGEISRITELVNMNKRDVEKGAVYHNRNHPEEEAFVEIKTDWEKIRRNVKNIKENANDIGKGSLIPRGKPEYLYSEQNQIKKMILQHHKIDSFITDNSSTARYKLWVQGNEEFSIEQKEFTEAYKKENEIKKNISNMKEEIRKIKSELSKLENNKTSFNTILNLLAEYNNTNILGENLIFKEGNDQLEVYDTLINEINVRIRKHETLQNNLKINLQKINAITSYGVKEVMQTLQSGPLVLESIKQCRKHLEQVKEQKRLAERMKRNEKEYNQIKENFSNLSTVKKYGFDKIIVQNNFWKDSEISHQNIVSEINNLLSNVKALVNENSEIELILTSKKERKLLTEKKSTLLKRCDDYQNTQTKLVDVQKRKGQIENKIVSLQLEKEKNLQIISFLFELRLPKHIGQVTNEHIDRLVNIVDDENRLGLEELLAAYKLSVINLLACREEIEDAEQNEADISRIRMAASSYLMDHKETCECPVCHNLFPDWNSLYQNILSIRNEKSQILKEKRNILIQEQDLQQEKYEYIKEKIEDIIGKKEKAQNELCESISQKKDTAIKELQTKTDEISALTIELNKIAAKTKQAGFMGEIISHENIENWFQNEEKNIEEFYSGVEKQRNKNNGRLEQMQKLLLENQKKKEELIYQKEMIQSDVQLLKYIQFLQHKPESYDLRVDYKQISEKKEELEIQLLAEREQLEGILALKLDADELHNQLEIADKKVKDYNEWLKLCEGVPELSISGIKNYESEIRHQIERNNRGVEILKQVREENSARTYLQNYKKTAKLYDEKNNKIDLEYGHEKTAHLQYKDKKANLENTLKKYFSQDGMNEIYKKIDPHYAMKKIRYNVDFSEKDEPELKILVGGNENHLEDEYRPEWYFSTAQLNAVAFSSFFSNGLMVNNCSMGTILVDDPIGHFDDMNVLGMADLLRSIIEKSNIQIILSTHEERVFRILQRKISSDYYSSKFIRLEEIQ